MNHSTLRYYWEALRTSYWFLPAWLGIAAIALAFVTVSLDQMIHQQKSWNLTWTYSGGPEGARAVLATVAGSMITVAGVVFSITIVALSLASGQFGSRLLRNFIRDRSNQFMLGTFTATFLYCLLVLRTVRGTDEEQFVPGVSVTTGILLAIFNLAVLIYFIHHVAISIQATHVIQAVCLELRETIDRLWPEEMGDEPTDSTSLGQHPFSLEESVPIVAHSSGYVDAIDDHSLLELAEEHDLVVRLAHRPGHFAIEETPLAWAWPQQRVSEEVIRRIRHTFLLAPMRTPFQDIEFTIDQLVEVAVRALSPGINDPFTAITCIHRLGEALCSLTKRNIPSALRHDRQGRLRILAYAANFRAVADAAFNQIRQNGAGNAAVLISLLETMAVIISIARRKEDRLAVAHHAELVLRAARRSLPEEADLADVEERFQSIQRILEKRLGENPPG